MKKALLFTALFTGALLYAQEECTPVAELNENFNSFTTGPGTSMPQNCWSTLSDGPMVYIDGEAEEEEYYVTFYASNFANTDAFLITPELTNLSGNYELSFDTQRIIMGPPPAPGTVTIQLGTLSDNTDSETFIAFGDPITVIEENVTHNIAITAAEGSYIAFKITGDTPHNAALIDNVVWNEILTECAAVETLDENFNSFEQGTDPLDQNCWTANNGAPLVYIDGNEDSTENFVSVYAMFTPNGTGYLVSPELSTMNGEYELSFDTGLITPTAPGAVTIQVGTVAAAGDFESFTAYGDLITLNTTDVTSFTNMVLPASETQKHIAFKITTTGSHDAAFIDNVVWSEAETNDLEYFNSNKASISLYPNPSSDKNVTIAFNNFTAEGTISVYSLTGAKVFEVAANATPSLQLHIPSLTSGMYLVKFEGENYTETQKLIIK